MSTNFAAKEVNTGELVKEWKRVCDRIPECMFKQHGNSVVALLETIPPFVSLAIDEKGSPRTGWTEIFIGLVDERHGAITSTAQAVKAFPFENPPDSLEKKVRELEDASHRFAHS